VGVVTLKKPEPAAEVRVALVGDMEMVQGAPAWVTLKVLPCMVAVPALSVAVPFDATVTLTVPLLFLNELRVELIHGSFEETVGFEQLLAPVARTATFLLPPLATKDMPVGEMVYLHGLSEVNVALTLLLDVIRTVHVLPEVESQPEKLVKVEPVSGVAVTVTGVP
jgi:hypothetical protein